MRLLNARTHVLEEFFEPNVPPYAILSHRWEEEEILYADIVSREHCHKRAFRKLEFTCRQALRDGFDLVWIDTCCIDKTSSAELSEAINSMFRWYSEARVCYAYLSDTTSEDQLASSSWFKRGWTLQELIAPREVRFYILDWSRIDSYRLTIQIAEITGIPTEILDRNGESLRDVLDTYSVARRMSWAASRETTRIEDQAYSLIGLFNVNVPLLYGEGERAFIRLQEEILKQGTDLSVLAWHHVSRDRSGRRELFAKSPKDFVDCDAVQLAHKEQYPVDNANFTMTNLGLRIESPYIVNASIGSPGHRLALSLGCWEQKDITKLIALKLDPLTLSEQRQHGSERLCHSGWDTDGARCEDRLVSIDLFASPAIQEWPYVVISREATKHREAPRYDLRFYTHLWIQLYEEPWTLPWEVVETYPKHAWNRQTLTIDLAQLHPKDRINDSKGRPITLPNQVAYVALQDYLGNVIAIHFVQVDQRHYHPYWSEIIESKCYFAVVDYYDSQIHQKLEVSDLVARGSTQGSCQLSLQGGYMVNVKLRDAKQPGVFIAQLLVTTERIDPPFIVDPPYELEANVPGNQTPAKLKMDVELSTETEEGEEEDASLACRLSEVPDVSGWRRGTVQDFRSNYRFWKASPQ